MANKQIILYIAFILLLFNACTNETELSVSLSTLTLEAKIGKFLPADNLTTRVTDEGYSTSFTDGDKIGVTVIKNGKIVDGVNNICFTYNASDNKWIASDADLLLYYYQDVTYLAYYPYSSAMNDITDKQQIIDAFTPKTDQSTYADYTASDLMIAEGKPETHTLVLPFEHSMSLLEIRIAERSYVTTDGSFEYGSPIDKIPTFSITVNGTSCSAYRYSSMSSRLITKPGANITFNLAFTTNDGRDFTRNETLTSTVQGKYTKYSYQHGITITRDLQVGDFYYQDGSILPKDSTFYQFDSNPCIGIIYYIGIGSEDKLSFYEGKIPAIHGYVLSLHEASKVWGDGSKVWGMGTSGGAHYGFASTQMIMKGVAEGKSFPACSYCVEYTPTPTGVSSGWYLPTTGQLRTFVINPGTINAQLNKIPGATVISGGYLSSSECSSSQIWGVTTGKGSYYYYSKGGSYKTRPLLTF